MNSGGGKVHRMGLNDKEIAEDILTGEKQLTDAYALGSIEAQDPNLRQLMATLHQQSVNDAGHVFGQMQERGWYSVRPASSQDVTEIRNTIARTRQSLEPRTMGQNMGMVDSLSQQYGGGIDEMMGQGYQQQIGQGQYYGGPQNLPNWTRYEVPPEGGQSSVQIQPNYNYGAGQQPAYGLGQSGYQQQLPQWTRQEVPGESTQRATGGPVGQAAYPGGPTSYYQGHQGQQPPYQPKFQQQQMTYQPQHQQQPYGFGPAGYQQQQLPNWTRQEVPGESTQRATGGPVGQAAYPGGPTSYYQGNQGQQPPYQPQYQQQLPNWTRQEVGFRGYYGGDGQQASGGTVGYTGNPGGPSTYQGQGMGTPQQSIYGQNQPPQGYNPYGNPSRYHQ